MCGDATNWDEDAYRQSILKEREIRTRTIFRTVWAPSKNPNPDTIVVASSDGSLASYSVSTCISQLQLGFSGTKAQQPLVAEPQGFLQGHDGPAYDIKFYGNGEDTLLLSDFKLSVRTVKESEGSRLSEVPNNNQCKVQTTMCGDATNWDEDAYRQSILKEREIRTRTIFRTVWAPSKNPNPDTIVVASSDGSLASYSVSTCISQLQLGFSGTKAQQPLVAEPQGFLQGHDGPAYDIKFYGNGEDTLLLSCGDDGHIRGWRWKEFTNSDVLISLQGNHMKPVLDLVNPQHKGPWGALSPIPENNAIAVNMQEGSIFSASGDCCAYCWDVETGKIKVVFKGHSDYLHCVVARSSVNQVITGSEDGTARIWGCYLDCRSGKCTQVINPAENTKSKGFFSCVSCIALDGRESWLACGGGRSLSIWNLPASECVSRISTRASVQDVLFDDNQVLAVGAEPLLCRFDINGAILSQIQCAPLSAFSVSVHPSGVTAVGGYGGLVDVISQFGSHLCTFRCRSI
ncbi:THO complex subunit 6 [Morella rubra]|uniref:THO complex subunit 6 n=1 Tax=Morella rubra TaxID=262757 RepID=A0A6A1VB02_9ROSI|nr:THO complex subunit 6 [Morella rubra]